jgi:hypothetical protein
MGPEGLRAQQCRTRDDNRMSRRGWMRASVVSRAKSAVSVQRRPSRESRRGRRGRDGRYLRSRDGSLGPAKVMKVRGGRSPRLKPGVKTAPLTLGLLGVTFVGVTMAPPPRNKKRVGRLTVSLVGRDRVGGIPNTSEWLRWPLIPPEPRADSLPRKGCP